MAGMGDGYVGTAQDAVRIRRLEEQREAERQKIQDLTKTVSEKAQPGLHQFGSNTFKIRETAFKKETVGLVTREECAEKGVTIQIKIEKEEKEQLQKLQQEEEELQAQKRQKQKIRGNSHLPFSNNSNNGKEDKEEEKEEPKRLACRKLDK